MGALDDLQQQLISRDFQLSEVLLTLKLIAARLESNSLEQWVGYEAEGYPNSVELPDYRKLSMAVYGTFSGPFGSGVRNAPIPPALIEALIGNGASVYNLRVSAAGLCQMASDKKGIHLDLSNWMIRLRRKIYPDFEPAQIIGAISQPVLLEAVNAIRARLLTLTIELERRVPEIKNQTLKSIGSNPQMTDTIVHQTVYGTVNTNYGAGTIQSHTHIIQGNAESVERCLTKSGLEETNAKELANIITTEQPAPDGWSVRSKQWLAERLTKGLDEGVKGGISELAALIPQIARQYWAG